MLGTELYLIEEKTISRFWLLPIEIYQIQPENNPALIAVADTEDSRLWLGTRVEYSK
jgi:hypothetical protein